MVGGIEKENYLKNSKGLIFPVLWHEPFGLAIIESLHYGCPVFGTPYGSLPELINNDIGFLSNNKAEISEALLRSDTFDKNKCNQYVNDKFNSKVMAINYLKKYEIVLNKKTINSTEPKLLVKQTKKYLDIF